MKIKLRGKLRNIIKIFGVLSLSLCILFSSIQISFAQGYVPSLTDVDELIGSQSALDWIIGCLQTDPDSHIVVFVHQNEWTNVDLYWIYWCSADVSFYFDYSSQNMACNSLTGLTGKVYGTDHPERHQDSQRRELSEA